MSITLKFLAENGKPIVVSVGSAEMQRLAQHWHYVLRSRRRWIDSHDLRQRVERRAEEHLKAIGLGTEQLMALATTDVVQVSMSITSDNDSGWEVRLMPWEYLLPTVTARYRSKPLIVIRHLETGVPENILQSPLDSVFVSGAPGRLRHTYDFDVERQVLQKYLAGAIEWDELSNPTLEQLKQYTSKKAPQLIHISAIDSLQGTRLIEEFQYPSLNKHDLETEVKLIPDGIFFRDNACSEKIERSRDVVKAVTSGDQKPALVSFNLYNSSARLAAFTVAEGAGVAIGFQDIIDDKLAEIFFVNFYLNLSRSNWNALEAVKKTFRCLEQYPNKMSGAGIVIWSGTTLIGEASYRRQRSRAKRRTAVAIAEPTRTACTKMDLKAEVKPSRALNYSILHNRQSIFEKFNIYRFHPSEIFDLSAEVELQLGNERFGHQSIFAMPHHVLDLSNEITIGLTSEMARSLQESIHTTLFVRLSTGKTPFFSKTFPVTFLPTDEWRLDSVGGIWLPSFVLPRDPAVLEIIVSAQRYLCALRDDAFAGFDGYQSVGDDPAHLKDVDAQTRAIWSALLLDFRLNYINPPPVFTAASQRLRTPSDVLRGRRGTCIDLTLLISACLEFVNIMPVIFLFGGHAFPGYWRNEKTRDQFLVTNPVAHLLPNLDNQNGMEFNAETYVQRYAWEFDKSRLREVTEAVDKGDVVPLESTILTKGGSFLEAKNQATKHLREAADFYCMLDIGLARHNHVTPLPLASLPNYVAEKTSASPQ